MTASMTWITPFLHTISVFTMFALSTWTLPSETLIMTFDPWTVFASFSFTTSAASTFPDTTW